MLNKTVNGTNYYKNDGAVEDEWNYDAHKDEDATCLVIVIKRTKLNACVKDDCRLYFDVG